MLPWSDRVSVPKLESKPESTSKASDRSVRPTRATATSKSTSRAAGGGARSTSFGGWPAFLMMFVCAIYAEGAPSLRFLQGRVVMLPARPLSLCTNPVAHAFVVPALCKLRKGRGTLGIQVHPQRTADSSPGFQPGSEWYPFFVGRPPAAEAGLDFLGRPTRRLKRRSSTVLHASVVRPKGNMGTDGTFPDFCHCKRVA